MSLHGVWQNIFLLWSISTVIRASAFGKNAPYFRNDYTYEETTDAFYKLNRVSIPWSDAVSWCREESAELAFPASEQEANILLKHFSQATHEIWLALHDQYSEGVFISTNGSSVTNLYNNWLVGQPDDNGDAGEDCVSLSREGYYNDVACNTKIMFVCKKNNENIDMNLKCLTHDFGYKLSPVTKSCYKIHPEPKTWHQAFRICETELGGLVEINSQQEADYLVKELERYPISSLVGYFKHIRLTLIDANELLSMNNFVTRTGKSLKEVGYNEWMKGEPNNYGGVEHCGCMDRNGKLYDLGCDDPAMFICEKKSIESVFT